MQRSVEGTSKDFDQIVKIFSGKSKVERSKYKHSEKTYTTIKVPNKQALASSRKQKHAEDARKKKKGKTK